MLTTEAHEAFLKHAKTCTNCKVGKFQVPDDMHPSYVLCDTCGAMHLTYSPQDYQEEAHRNQYLLNDDGSFKVQTIGLFGGRKSVAAVKRDKIGETLRA